MISMIRLAIIDQNNKEVEWEDLTSTGKEIIIGELNQLRKKIMGE